MSHNDDLESDWLDSQRSYSGYLITSGLSDEAMKSVSTLAERMHLFTIHENAIEIEYTGRDTSRIVVKSLLQLAQLIRDAEGEVRCEISGDTGQLAFEFYRIREGRLFRERGRIVRETAHEVTETTL